MNGDYLNIRINKKKTKTKSNTITWLITRGVLKDLKVIKFVNAKKSVFFSDKIRLKIQKRQILKTTAWKKAFLISID